MKTKPILFSTPMVLALLEGRKTQTRRVVKPQPIDNTEIDGNFFDGLSRGYVKVDGHPDWQKRFADKFAPYAVGDVLWVRETWANTVNVNQMHPWPDRPCVVTDSDDGSVFSAIIYKADGDWHWCDDDGFSTEKSYWKPSIFMPKAACRLFLKVTNVRVERLQSISQKDATAEGIGVLSPTHYKSYNSKYSSFTNPINSFGSLWQSINGPESWGANPFVWVIEFERCEKPEDFG